MTDKQFIQPVVITVKRHKSVKVALDVRALNNELIKDKYQMPSLENNSQKQFGKNPTPKTIIEEIAIDFPGPFKIAHSTKTYLIVSVDSKSGWPDAKFLRAPTTTKVIEFLTKYISDNGIPRQIRTDPGTVFKSTKFQEFCQK